MESFQMVYALAGFVFGIFIPYVSRRFAKFMPATMAYALYRIVCPGKKVSAEKRRNNWHYAKMISQYRWRGVMWGILTAALSYGVFYEWGSPLIWWKLVFIWILLLLAEIDIRMLLLPDEVLRFPLDEMLLIIRGQKILKLKKMDYTEHPDSRHLKLEKTEDFIPEWYQKMQKEV